jgi:hypothetical protein
VWKASGRIGDVREHLTGPRRSKCFYQSFYQPSAELGGAWKLVMGVLVNGLDDMAPNLFKNNLDGERKIHEMVRPSAANGCISVRIADRMT